MERTLLNRNEVFQGPSPAVLNVLKNFKPNHVNFYIDGYYNSILIPKLSKTFGVPEEQIIVSYGEEDFFRILFDKLNQREDSVLTHEFHYAYYKKYLDFKGITLNAFKMNEEKGNFIFDIEDCVRQYRKSKSRIILLTSPNNPTGNSLSPSELEIVLKNVDLKTLVVVDEAYYGFDERYDQQAFLSLLKKYKNFILLRSFSKLYALAGLRIGFALCGTNAKSSLKYQNRYLGLSRVLEEAAIAALESGNYYKKLSREIITDREHFISETKITKSFKPFHSNANFVLLRVDNKTLSLFKESLAKQNMIVGKFVNESLYRVTVGYKKHTESFLKLLKAVSRDSRTV